MQKHKGYVSIIIVVSISLLASLSGCGAKSIQQPAPERDAGWDMVHMDSYFRGDDWLRLNLGDISFINAIEGWAKEQK